MKFDFEVGCRLSKILHQNINWYVGLVVFGFLHTKKLSALMRTLNIFYAQQHILLIQTSVCTTFKMGVAKKEKSRKERQGKTGDSMSNVKTKGENFYRYNFKLALL